MNRLEKIIDVQRQTSNPSTRRDTLFQAVNFAAEQFLLPGNWEESIQAALKLLGEAAGVSRVYIIKKHAESDDGRLRGQLLYEWTAPGIVPLSDHPEFHNFPDEKADYRYRWDALETAGFGRSLPVDSSGTTRRVPFHQGSKSSVTIPIIINNTSWGLIGFEDIHQEIHWSELETDLLKMAANILAGAIQRQALQKVRDDLEQRVEEHTTALKRTYNRLIQTEKIASLGLLVAGIAHEINNPNNFITFNIPILRDYLQEIIPIVDSYAESRRDYKLFGMSYPEFRADLFKLLNNIAHGSNRINSTVSRLREFARPQGNDDLRLVNLRPVIEQSIEICQSQVKSKVKKLEVNIPQNLPLTYVKPQIIEQVLINLLTNAAQAADKENSWIKVSMELGKTEKDYIILEVRDNGCGISSKACEEIFDPFYTSKGTEMGTGLGLYISRNLVESLGGRIEVKSKSGEGSTFRVILPKLSPDPKRND